MKTPRNYWYPGILLLAALLIDEHLVQWMLAVKVGRLSVVDGFRDAYEYFTPQEFLFLAAFRILPYLCVGIVLGVLAKTRFRNLRLPAFIGGLIGIVAFVVWGLWNSLRPYYTEEHVSSTTAIAFVFIPLYAVPVGVICSLVVAALFGLIRFLGKKRTTPPGGGGIG